MKLLAVVGLKREARIVASGEIEPVIGGGDAAGLAVRLEAAITQHRPDGVISFGLAGALDPALSVGDVVVASAVIAEGERRWPTDPGWRRDLVERLPGAILAEIAGSDGMLIASEAKAALHRATKAAAADMESHIAARAAARHDIPFATIRAVSDTAERTLPKAVLAGMKPDGGANLAGVLGELARRPWEAPALIRTGLEAEAAFRALLGCRQRLGGALGLPDIQRP